jgi:hypothetical protein
LILALFAAGDLPWTKMLGALPAFNELCQRESEFVFACIVKISYDMREYESDSALHIRIYSRVLPKLLQ